MFTSSFSWQLKSFKTRTKLCWHRYENLCKGHAHCYLFWVQSMTMFNWNVSPLSHPTHLPCPPTIIYSCSHFIEWRNLHKTRFDAVDSTHPHTITHTPAVRSLTRNKGLHWTECQLTTHHSSQCRLCTSSLPIMSLAESGNWRWFTEKVTRFPAAMEMEKVTRTLASLCSLAQSWHWAEVTTAECRGQTPRQWQLVMERVTGKMTIIRLHSIDQTCRWSLASFFNKTSLLPRQCLLPPLSN